MYQRRPSRKVGRTIAAPTGSLTIRHFQHLEDTQSPARPSLADGACGRLRGRSPATSGRRVNDNPLSIQRRDESRACDSHGDVELALAMEPAWRDGPARTTPGGLEFTPDWSPLLSLAHKQPSAGTAQMPAIRARATAVSRSCVWPRRRSTRQTRGNAGSSRRVSGLPARSLRVRLPSRSPAACRRRCDRSGRRASTA
jgi:hypothetical protein